jgi:DNA-directed RNA polymerase specialized sigma24 family protein
MRTHRSLLHGAAMRVLGCDDAARDAVQEALIAFWLHRPLVGREGAWLVRTVVHRSLHARRTERRRQRWEREAGSACADTCTRDGLRELERRETHALLAQALGALRVHIAPTRG